MNFVFAVRLILISPILAFAAKIMNWITMNSKILASGFFAQRKIELCSRYEHHGPPCKRGTILRRGLQVRVVMSLPQRTLSQLYTECPSVS